MSLPTWICPMPPNSTPRPVLEPPSAALWSSADFPGRSCRSAWDQSAQSLCPAELQTRRLLRRTADALSGCPRPGCGDCLRIKAALPLSAHRGHSSLSRAIRCLVRGHSPPAPPPPPGGWRPPPNKPAPRDLEVMGIEERLRGEGLPKDCVGDAEEKGGGPAAAGTSCELANEKRDDAVHGREDDEQGEPGDGKIAEEEFGDEGRDEEEGDSGKDGALRTRYKRLSLRDEI